MTFFISCDMVLINTEVKNEEREEGKAVGIAEGMQQGKTSALKELVNNGMLSVENAAKVLNMF